MKKLLQATLLGVLPGLLAAQDTAQGLQPLVLNDQFGKQQAVTVATKRIYFTHDMASDKLLKAALREHGQNLLDTQQAVVIADVSGMPSIIRSTMALPAMKKRGYRIGIDSDGKASAALPRQPKATTVIDIDSLQMTAVQYVADEKHLAAVVKNDMKDNPGNSGKTEPGNTRPQ